ILWAARWEHDKNPETFFEALKLLKQRGVVFRLSVIGERFRDEPEVFDWARRHFANRIDRWGYQPDRADYEAALCEADVFVSTAEHEFFGLSAVEAALAGAYPLLPERLAYPEIFGLTEDPAAKAFFYTGNSADLANKLTECARRLEAGASLGDLTQNLRQHLRRFQWPLLAPILDEGLTHLASDPIH
ncbi:MAG: glycosyltransferase, partial [Sedimentisphaerales bacterium]|nr:glycosyltransferase [Sedimentisphaerales bacterium]